MARTSNRQSFELETRLRLAEEDLDLIESLIEKLDARLGRILGVCVSLLVSVSTACILLAVNLVVHG